MSNRTIFVKILIECWVVDCACQVSAAIAKSIITTKNLM